MAKKKLVEHWDPDTRTVDLHEVDPAVDHPQHYNMGRIEVIDIIEDADLNFNLGNVIKYVLRAPHKGEPVQDLEKALWYLGRELNRVRKVSSEPG